MCSQKVNMLLQQAVVVCCSSSIAEYDCGYLGLHEVAWHLNFGDLISLFNSEDLPDTVHGIMPIVMIYQTFC